MSQFTKQCDLPSETTIVNNIFPVSGTFYMEHNRTKNSMRAF